MEDPFLNYLSLGFLIFVIIVLFYGIIAIHDIPAKIAHSRHHPHEDAIHAAGWISLFMLHILWPFLWIWAMMYQPERGWGFDHKPGEPTSPKEAVEELEELRHRLTEVEAKLGSRSTHLGRGGSQPGRVPESMVSVVEKEKVPGAQPAPTGSRGTKR
jgi:hypothetical protein